ncbi:MAG TPA: bifunctional glutamate N-acetyltransferase/amino-acid acetyltransferase ArgJ, partial [Terriglobales bacterium]
MTVHGPEGKLHIPAGYKFASTTAGIKASGRPDLALAEAPFGAAAAAVFTRNRVVAAPLVVDRANLKKSSSRVRAVVVNSGNANCATGKRGITAADQVCKAVGSALAAAPEFIFPSSTGIIGVQLPVEKLTSAVPALVSARAEGESAFRAFATAIMTTDTVAKIATACFKVGNREVNIAAACKGSGMIHPDLATMLVYIFTDVNASPGQLDAVLRSAVEVSFNAMSVDGDTSTNDTVLLLANGASEVKFGAAGVAKKFQNCLIEVCQSLAEQVIRDGEGAKHLIRLHIEQARSVAEARQVARSIANSPLVKTAWAGCDPNWGRILSSVGKSGVEVVPEKVNIFIGKQQVCRAGMVGDFDANAAHELMKAREYDIRVQLGRGRAALTFLTCDLT